MDSETCIKGNCSAKNAATFGTLEKPHLAPSGKRRNSYKSPCDIAVTAFALDIHGATPFAANAQGELFTWALILGTVVFQGSKTPCSAFDSSVMYSAASRKVISFLPLGNTIGSKNL
jgi:hypothetical protein